MKKLLTILICLLTTHSAFAVERWAIVVGIGVYPADSGWSRINGDNDIELVVPMLCNLGFPKAHIKTLANQDATKQHIRATFYEYLIPKLNKGDVVYFHFSGHGQEITDLDGDEENGYDEAMIPYDAKCKYDTNGYRGENHLVDDELNDWLHDVRRKVGPGGKILVALDACHSGGGSRDEGDDEANDHLSIRGTNDRFVIDPIPDNIAPHPQRKVEWICISACQSKQNNYEYKAANNKKYGRLSWALHKILTADMVANELEAAITEQYQLLPPMPFPQDVHIEEISTELSNKTVL